MKAFFRIEYKTAWGENLQLVAGGKKFPMTYNEGGVWTVTIDKFTASMLADYGYELTRDGIIVRQEWKNHSRKAAKGENSFSDNWIDVPEGNCFVRILPLCSTVPTTEEQARPSLCSP